MPKNKSKFAYVMKEFYAHKLHSGSGGIVKNPKQAKAIAASEAGYHKKKKK